MFFKPKPPPKPRATPPPKPAIVQRDEPKPPPTPVEPSAPRTYQGPSIMFVLGDEVWFHGGLRVSVGDEKDGVKVLASDAPWSVTLGHMGGEYTLDLFNFSRETPGLSEKPARSRKPVPGLKIVEADPEPEPDAPARVDSNEPTATRRQ